MCDLTVTLYIAPERVIDLLIIIIIMILINYYE